ncbi:hypothetical protein WMY93_019151 [Mugilogobius chulae]|uniref:Alkylated DNA repair protein AlkB homologue 8 N-terminal domain-containing protein n=1 Tax=Mugilogobius chulae TaxID=88201 RepID=A0AAW0NER3_9GOBI
MSLSTGGRLSITTVDSIRFLGTTITQDLKWEPSISSLIKKAQQRMYFLRQLKKAKLPAQMMVQFYTAIIESILTSSITVWYAGATVRDRHRLQRIVRSAEKIGPKWKDVVSRCIKGHYQPLLLLYADPRGTPVVLQDSPCFSPNPHLELHCSTKAGYDSEDSGREPSISSDTRTDSSTDSCSHRTSRTRPLHQSTGSHLSSDSQATVVSNYQAGTPSQSSDTGEIFNTALYDAILELTRKFDSQGDGPAFQRILIAVLKVKESVEANTTAVNKLQTDVPALKRKCSAP